MKIDPKAKKSLIIAAIIAGGMFFVAAVFFLLLANSQSKQPEKNPTRLPNMAASRVKESKGTEIEGYDLMSKMADKENAEAAAAAGKAYVPAFTPLPQSVQSPKTRLDTSESVQPQRVYVRDEAYAEKLLSQRMKRLEELAASLQQEAYAPMSGGGVWRTQEEKQQSASNPAEPSASMEAADNKVMLVKAGERVFVQIDTAINTDEPSPVIGRILSGKAAGYKLFGATRYNPNYTVSIEFTQMTLPSGYAVPISAFAIDPQTGRTSVSGNVDYKIFERFVLPALAAAVSKYGETVGRQGTTIVIDSNTGTTTTSQNLTDDQVRDAAIGAGVGKIADSLSQQAAEAKPAVTTERNLGLEVVFMREVVVDERLLESNR